MGQLGGKLRRSDIRTFLKRFFRSAFAEQKQIIPLGKTDFFAKLGCRKLACALHLYFFHRKQRRKQHACSHNHHKHQRNHDFLVKPLFLRLFLIVADFLHQVNIKHFL